MGIDNGGTLSKEVVFDAEGKEIARVWRIIERWKVDSTGDREQWIFEAKDYIRFR